MVTLLRRDNQKPSKRLSKEFARSVYWNKYKKVLRLQQTKLDFFLKQILLESINYLS